MCLIVARNQERVELLACGVDSSASTPLAPRAGWRSGSQPGPGLTAFARLRAARIAAFSGSLHARGVGGSDRGGTRR